MQNILIFDQNVSPSADYGIGVFVELFRSVFKQKHYNVFVIDLYANINEFEITKFKDYSLVKFPVLKNKIKERSVVNTLPLYIENLGESVVFFNYTIQFRFAKILKERYSNINTVGIIHSLWWIWSMKGKENLFQKRVIINRSKPEFKPIYDGLVEDRGDIEFIDRVIALSDDSSKTMRTIYKVDKSKIMIIPNGIKNIYKKVDNNQIHNIKRELLIDPKHKVILYVGRIDSMKGIDVLVSAFNRIVSQRDDCILVVVGDGNFNVISSCIKRSASKIIFTGKISSEDVVKWYRIADVGVLPTLSEECSFVGIEMMMHGLPIVSTNGRGVRNMFHNMENSLTVNCYGLKSQFENGIYEAIMKILCDDELSNTLRVKSHQYYLDNYQYKTMSKNYLSLVDDLMK